MFIFLVLFSFAVFSDEAAADAVSNVEHFEPVNDEASSGAGCQAGATTTKPMTAEASTSTTNDDFVLDFGKADFFIMEVAQNWRQNDFRVSLDLFQSPTQMARPPGFENLSFWLVAEESVNCWPSSRNRQYGSTPNQVRLSYKIRSKILCIIRETVSSFSRIRATTFASAP